MVLRLLLILLIVSIGFTWLSRSTFFKVSQVNVSWDEGKFLTSEAEKRLKDNIREKIIFIIGQNQITQVKKDFPVIQTVKITKNYPATVNLSILTRKPSMVVIPINKFEEESASPSAINRIEYEVSSASNSAETYLLDSTGLVFWKGLNVAGQDLIHLLFARDFSFKVGQTTSDPAVQAGLKFIVDYQNLLTGSELPKISFLFSSTPDNLVVKLLSGNFLYLPVVDSYEKLDNDLKLILNKYQIEGKHLKKVDLRFKNPVVEY